MTIQAIKGMRSMLIHGKVGRQPAVYYARDPDGPAYRLLSIDGDIGNLHGGGALQLGTLAPSDFVYAYRFTD